MMWCLCNNTADACCYAYLRMSAVLVFDNNSTILSSSHRTHKKKKKKTPADKKREAQNAISLNWFSMTHAIDPMVLIYWLLDISDVFIRLGKQFSWMKYKHTHNIQQHNWSLYWSNYIEDRNQKKENKEESIDSQKAEWIR